MNRPSLVLVLVLALVPTAGLDAQPGAAPVPPLDIHVARFPIAASPIALSGDARPGQYIGVVGRRAAWLGEETGEAELWVHPLKLARRFHLDFRVPEYADPIRGEDVARRVEVRPEATTITYTHATFTVRAHIIAAVDEPALLVLLDADTVVPLDILVSFQSVLQYAWPGGLGGQYVTWSESQRAFLLSESLRRHNAVIGSPWATSATAHPAHALPEAPSTFVIAVDRARARREFIPIGIVAGIEPRDDVMARYRALFGRARELYEAKRAHVDRLRAEGSVIETPDRTLNLALEWARVNLDEQVVCNPDLGCGLVAGWGPSGASLRPGFGWFFGGDAAINSFAMSSLGQFDAVAQGLRFLATYQRADGKIAHEISQSAGRLPWFSEFPYAYYHADTTPFWIVAVSRYWRASGDGALVRELWPQIQKAFAWCRQQDGDGDGIMENTTAGLGAIEVGDLGADIHQDIYLAAVWIASLDAMQGLARAQGDAALADAAAAIDRRARVSLGEKYWLEAAGHHAFGILRSGTTSDALTVWPATAAAFGLLDPAHARRTLAALAGSRITTDWGARMLDETHRLYDPTHYNMGTVWPFVTGFLAWGHYRYQRPWAGFPLVHALASMAFDWARGRHPELLSGEYYRPLDTAVPQQFFATSMLVTPLVTGLLGWEPDAAAGVARLGPQLPPSWDRVSASLRVGAGRLLAVIERQPGGMTVRLRAEGPPLSMEWAPPLPAGARDARVTVDGHPVQPISASGALRAWRLPIGPREQLVTTSWTGGLEPEPPAPSLEPGQRSTGLRIVDFAWSGSAWFLDVEGAPGQAYDVTLRGAHVGTTEGGSITTRAGDTTTVRVVVPAGPQRYAPARVTLRP